MKDDITLNYEAASDVTKAQEAAERIEPLFGSYIRKVDPATMNGDGTNLTDFLADIMHWAAVEGHDFAAALSSAEMHFSAESDDEGDDEDPFGHLDDPAEREWLTNVSPDDVRSNAHRMYEFMRETRVAADSMIRELAFEKTAKALGISYEDLYDAWLSERPISN